LGGGVGFLCERPPPPPATEPGIRHALIEATDRLAEGIGRPGG
jgi:hypothetical protein